MPFLRFLENNMLVFFGLLLVGLMIFYAIGLKIGKGRRAEIGEVEDEGATLVVGSVLGLLAFILALNLSASSSRQESRMADGLEEVNAIGTAMLQADAAGGPQAGPITDRLREYLAIRYQFVRAAPHSPEIADLSARTDALQTKIWDLVKQRVAAEPNDVVSSLMGSINEAFDATSRMRLVMEYRLPVQLITLLLVMSLLGSTTVGYQFGLTGRKGSMAALVLSVVWCTMVTTIIDIGSGRIWTFRTDVRVYEWSMAGFGIRPPPPAD